jgi:hypothetical protein
MNPDATLERRSTVALSLLILVAYLLPVAFKTAFVHPGGRLFVTSKENIIVALAFVGALAFELQAMKPVMMISSGVLFLFLVVITTADLFVGYTQKLPGLILLMVLHGIIFLFIYYCKEVEAILGEEKDERLFRSK